MCRRSATFFFLPVSALSHDITFAITTHCLESEREKGRDSLTLHTPHATVHSSLVADAWLAWHSMPARAAINNNKKTCKNRIWYVQSQTLQVLCCIFNEAVWFLLHHCSTDRLVPWHATIHQAELLKTYSIFYEAKRWGNRKHAQQVNEDRTKGTLFTKSTPNFNIGGRSVSVLHLLKYLYSTTQSWPCSSCQLTEVHDVVAANSAVVNNNVCSTVSHIKFLLVLMLLVALNFQQLKKWVNRLEDQPKTTGRNMLTVDHTLTPSPKRDSVPLQQKSPQMTNNNYSQDKSQWHTDEEKNRSNLFHFKTLLVTLSCGCAGSLHLHWSLTLTFCHAELGFSFAK